MNTLEFFKEKYDQSLKQNGTTGLLSVRREAFAIFSRLGIPTVKHEEWKYTPVNSIFNKEFNFPIRQVKELTAGDLKAIHLPGHVQANELFFINGIYSQQLSIIRSPELLVLPLEKAATGEFKKVISENLGHSAKYQNDGINALNTAFVQGGVFINIGKGKITEHPVYIYQITDARSENVLSQPRSLVHVEESAQVKMVETYVTLGDGESFTNQVMEVVVEKDAMVEYYKIQNDAAHASQVSTTHFRQVGKCHVHTVVISLNGALVRNNLNVVLDAENNEAHLYGLYFPKGKTLIDNHTVVDNVKPNCFSNEFYKGILTDYATAVFNGKIFVRRDAQKTNAYQSNKNILLSDSASVNTKPQLEIFADDVKCSHGCTIGRLDEDSLYYLRSRGIPEKTAKALLIHAFVIDILEHIKLKPIRAYVDKLISKRLKVELN
jgi:Fe-S cluster assembly protein SufD